MNRERIRGCRWLANEENRERKIGGRRAIGLQRFALHNFVELECAEARDKTGGGRQGRRALYDDILGLKSGGKRMNKITQFTRAE